MVMQHTQIMFAPSLPTLMLIFNQGGHHTVTRIDLSRGASYCHTYRLDYAVSDYPARGMLTNFLHICLISIRPHPQDEECAFWLLVVLIEQILYPKTYSETLEGCQVEMGALWILIKTKLPVLWRHLRDIGAEVQHFSTDW